MFFGILNKLIISGGIFILNVGFFFGLIIVLIDKYIDFVGVLIIKDLIFSGDFLMGVFSFINGMKIICLENIGLISINSLVFLSNIGLYIFLLKDNVIVDIILIDFFDGLDGLVNFD